MNYLLFEFFFGSSVERLNHLSLSPFLTVILAIYRKGGSRRRAFLGLLQYADKSTCERKSLPQKSSKIKKKILML